MKPVLALAALVCTFSLAACSTPAAVDTAPAATGTPAEPAAAPNPLAQQTAWKGTLPCADCVGIEFKLVLYRNDQGEPTRYQLSRHYLGGKENLAERDRGDWEIRKGSFKQSGGSLDVYVLSPDDPNSRLLFLRSADNAIELLGDDGSRSDVKLNYTLLEVAD